MNYVVICKVLLLFISKFTFQYDKKPTSKVWQEILQQVLFQKNDTKFVVKFVIHLL